MDLSKTKYDIQKSKFNDTKETIFKKRTLSS